MGVARLTERRLRDARFRKTEEALFKVFFEEGGMKLGVGEIAERIGVNRTTIHRHHRAICEIMDNYEIYILEKYEELITEMRKRDDVELRRMYYETILFILQNRRIIGILIKKKNFRLLDKMVLMLKPEIMDFIRLSSDYERVFRVYTGEIMGLIVDWGLCGFQESEIVKLLNNMVYLIKSIRKRLSPLLY